MFCSDISGALAAEDVDCFALDPKQHLAILLPQGLPRFPVLQLSGYHVYYASATIKHRHSVALGVFALPILDQLESCGHSKQK